MTFRGATLSAARVAGRGVSIPTRGISAISRAPRSWHTGCFPSRWSRRTQRTSTSGRVTMRDDRVKDEAAYEQARAERYLWERARATGLTRRQLLKLAGTGA